MPDMGAGSERLRRAADPRVVGGVVVMAASAYLGLAITGSADATTVAVAARDLRAGVALQPGDVELHEVVLAEPERYVRSAQPTGTLRAPVLRGELLPRSAVVAEQSPLRLVAVPVAVDRLPPGLQRGSVVDVWAGARESVLEAVPVADVTDPERWSAGTATVVLAVENSAVPTLLAAVRGGEVDVTVYQDRP